MMDRHLAELLRAQNLYAQLFEKSKEALAAILKFIKQNENQLKISDLKEEQNEISFFFLGINFYIRIEYAFDRAKLVWGIKSIVEDKEKREPYVEQRIDRLGNLDNDHVVEEAGSVLPHNLSKIIKKLQESGHNSFAFK